jgi:DNA-binding CsgD family transcriptional regulator
MLYGRDAERARIGELLTAARDSRSGAVVLRGEAGIGKSALLEDAREQAADMHVLSARGVESESELPFAALHQLLRPALGTLDALPPPQAAALRGALGLGERTGDDRFLVSLAALTLLVEFAESRPVLCLVDDAHWLDTPSADTLVFVARRLEADRIALLFAAREGEERRFEGAGIPVLELGGLRTDAAEALLAEQALGAVAPHVRDQLLSHTHGNALALLELPRALSEAQLAGVEPLPAALPLTQGLERVFLERVRRLPEKTQLLLLVAAADDTGSLATVMHAADALGGDEPALDAAEQSGLVSVRGGRLDLRHPLVRSAVYQAAPSNERRAVHQALADALASEKDDAADRRVWHLAAATLEPDEEVAAGLERSAATAMERAGVAAAAAAFERAASLTPAEEPRLRRLYRAAQASWQAGRGGHAVALVNQALVDCPEPRLRADMLHLVGHIQHFGGPAMPSHDLLWDAARLVDDLDPPKAAAILSDAFEAALYGGDPGAALTAAKRARELAPRNGSVSDYLAELNLAEALFINGIVDEGVPLFEHAVELLGANGELRADPHLATRGAIALCWLERCGEARGLLAGAVASARERGMVGVLPYVLFMAAWAARRSGAWKEALAAANEGASLARELGQEIMLVECLFEVTPIAAARGEEAEFRASVEEGTAIADRVGAQYLTEALGAQVGVLELTLGRLDEAASELEESAKRITRLGIRLNEFVPAPDLVEALARLGRIDEARSALDLLANHVAHPRTGEAVIARCRALVADDAEFEQHFVDSLALHPDDEDVFGKARTHLCFGERLRRARRRAEAREHLRAAQEVFERLGANPWAERARAELRASGETARKRDPSTVDQLTPQELQIAGFVAEGLTNKEIAAQLFLSPRTIDSHLRNVFQKLNISSRTQLARMPLGDPSPALSRA